MAERRLVPANRLAGHILRLPRGRSLPTPVRHGARLVLLALVIEYLLVPQLAGSRKSWHLLLDVSNGWLLLAAGLELFSLAVYALLTRAVLPRGGQLPTYWTVLRIDLSTLAVSHVVPAGSAVGLGLGFRLLTQSGVRAGDAVFAKSTQAIGSAVVLNVLLGIALVASIALHGFSPVFGPVAVVGALLLGAAGTLVVLLTRAPRPVAARVGRIAGRLPKISEEAARSAVTSVAAQVQDFVSDRRLLARTTILAAANWLLDAGALWACVRAFGHSLGPVGLLVPYGIAGVLAALPFTPAGLGIVEGFLIPALVGFSVPRGIAILGVLAWRALNYLLPIPLGFLAYLTLPAGSRREVHD